MKSFLSKHKLHGINVSLKMTIRELEIFMSIFLFTLKILSQNGNL